MDKLICEMRLAEAQFYFLQPLQLSERFPSPSSGRDVAGGERAFVSIISPLKTPR